jgi:hypothetical protein
VNFIRWARWRASIWKKVLECLYRRLYSKLVCEI